ncbi:type III secretion system stator protein SctL [Peristeroidobacter agariperforans]|uniref:type III secretion system stator protein SctL n=1 Tax=Peristeroidobacter agariperforans TaxID=268404 RepID=UPI00101D354A|nr:type III secretion system stator protein SctL [Peristeroidobacter agariperforans]
MLSMTVAIDKRKLAAATAAVVKGEEFSALITAQEIVMAAQRHAETIKAEMHDQVEAARREGYEAGSQEARTEFSATVVETVAEMELAFLRLEPRIVNTVMSALQQILGQIDERGLMEQLIRRVLGEARHRKQLRLRVAAVQFDAINQWLAGVLREFPDVEFIDLLKDPAAAPGTCILESEFGAIDASLDVQLAAVRRGLMSAFIDRRVAAAAARE